MHETSLSGASAWRYRRDLPLPRTAQSNGARNVLRTIYAGIHIVAERPYASQRTDDPEVRVKVMRRYRYKIFYRIVEDDTVEIMHVRHTSRRPWSEEAD